jgi:hypothetical protein
MLHFIEAESWGYWTSEGDNSAVRLVFTPMEHHFFCMLDTGFCNIMLDMFYLTVSPISCNHVW